MEISQKTKVYIGVGLIFAIAVVSSMYVIFFKKEKKIAAAPAFKASPQKRTLKQIQQKRLEAMPQEDIVKQIAAILDKNQDAYKLVSGLQLKTDKRGQNTFYEYNGTSLSDIDKTQALNLLSALKKEISQQNISRLRTQLDDLKQMKTRSEVQKTQKMIQ